MSALTEAQCETLRMRLVVFWDKWAKLPSGSPAPADGESYDKGIMASDLSSALHTIAALRAEVSRLTASLAAVQQDAAECPGHRCAICNEPIGALHTCAGSPSLSNLPTEPHRHAAKWDGTATELTATCRYCEQPIRRNHIGSSYWYLDAARGAARSGEGIEKP